MIDLRRTASCVKYTISENTLREPFFTPSSLFFCDLTVKGHIFTSRWVVAFLALQSVVRAVVEVVILNKVTAEESERKLYEAINLFLVLS